MGPSGSTPSGSGGGSSMVSSGSVFEPLETIEEPPPEPDGVEPDGPIDSIYDDLGDFLSRTHEVIEFAFDWRRPMEDEARRLASAVDAALGVRDKSGQPVRMIAHSMGGL